ncbi:MAG: response regulator [Endomicrobium sp.]|jgi:CheY-like chemotaxis protein|nr:response regulator [Endomicrobium sp.]
MEQDKKLNILIADDEEGLRFSLASILEIEGHDVKTAENGLEALRVAGENDFDVAFFDIRMPEMNGVDAFKEMKKINPKTMVVMMTAYAMNDLVKESIKEGAFACISKPFEIDDVLNTVKEINSKPVAFIISPDAETVNFLVSNLRQSGFIAVPQPNDDKALEFIGRRRPSLIFIDADAGISREFSEKLESAAGGASIVVAGNSGLKIKNAKVIEKPVAKDDMAEFFGSSGKSKVAIISADTLASNNLKLSIVAKGYDVTYFPSMDNFFKSTDLNAFGSIVFETGANSEIESLCKKSETGEITGKLIRIIDFENPATGCLDGDKIKFLQKSSETSELLKMVEE